MRTTVEIEKEVDFKTLLVKAEARYWEDSTVNEVKDVNGDLIPCRDGDMWCPIIDIDTGIIRNWEQGKKASIHFKVCDAGSYYLLDEKGETILSIENDYVPKMMCPKDKGYGDYIIMDIDENGKIEDFKFDLDGFYTED